jgi:chemotaxis protein MotB
MLTGTFQKRSSPRRTPIDTGRWQIVYTGFILIMLSFFILLTSFVSLDASKITQFVNSFSDAVNVLSHGRSIEQGDMLLDVELQILAKQELLAQLFERVRQAIREEDLDQVAIQRTDRGVVLTLQDKLLFDSGAAHFSSDAYPRMTKIGRMVRKIGVPVQIEGHTDDRPIRTAAFPSNWELSAARAVTVLRYLTETLGVDAQQLSAVGFSEYQPIVPNDSDTHRAMNRRVDLIFKIDENA